MCFIIAWTGKNYKHTAVVIINVTGNTAREIDVWVWGKIIAKEINWKSITWNSTYKQYEYMWNLNLNMGKN